MRRVLVVCAVTSMIALSLAVPASAATRTINGVGTHWSPASVTINRGDGVRWHASSGNHHLKSYGGNWSFNKPLGLGTTTPRKAFPHAGTFKFYCTIHGSVAGGTCSGMCGKVVVH